MKFYYKQIMTLIIVSLCSYFVLCVALADDKEEECRISKEDTEIIENLEFFEQLELLEDDIDFTQDDIFVQQIWEEGEQK